jgi:beta-xylosidase
MTMKSLLSILACLLLASCASDVEPYTPAPAPPVGSYVITQRGPNGEVMRQYETTSYQHNFFPPSVSFDADGKRVTIKGSWDVEVKQP